MPDQAYFNDILAAQDIFLRKTKLEIQQLNLQNRDKDDQSDNSSEEDRSKYPTQKLSWF